MFSKLVVIKRCRSFRAQDNSPYKAVSFSVPSTCPQSITRRFSNNLLKMKPSSITLAASILASVQRASCELSGSVGPLTSRATKATTKTCNVHDYGAVASMSDDLGPPLISAFADCSSGGTGKGFNFWCLQIPTNQRSVCTAW